jgi:hypothetical protein
MLEFNRTHKVALASVLLLLAAGSAVVYVLHHGTTEEYPDRESLLAVACDPNQGQDARGKAVFGLFTTCVPPNASAATMRKVFGNCDWVAEADIYRFEAQDGEGHPIRVKVGGTLFNLRLFAPEGETSYWLIYAEFSGGNHSPEEVRRFFSPKAEPDPQLRLTKFALWNLHTGKKQVFDETGRHPPAPPRDDQ